jgi:hypothetical protein
LINAPIFRAIRSPFAMKKSKRPLFAKLRIIFSWLCNMDATASDQKFFGRAVKEKTREPKLAGLDQTDRSVKESDQKVKRAPAVGAQFEALK